MATEQTQTYRTMPARVVGWVILIALAALAVLIGRTEASLGNSPLTPTGLMSVVAAIVWVALLRPCVRISEDRIEMRNLVTDVVIPFSRIKAVRHVWALEVIDNLDAKHSSWAIPVRRDMRRRWNVDSYAEATTRGKAAEGNNAEELVGRVEQAVQRWRLEGGRSEQGQGVRPTPAWTAIVPLLLSAGLAAASLMFA